MLLLKTGKIVVFEITLGLATLWFLALPVEDLFFSPSVAPLVGELQNVQYLQKKKVSLCESLVAVFQHADFLWLRFWKLAALGKILWPALWFCCEPASPLPIPGESVLLGLDAYSSVFTPQGISSLCLREWTAYSFLHIREGLSLKVYSKYCTIPPQPPSEMVLSFSLFFFNLLSMASFPPLHIRSSCWICLAPNWEWCSLRAGSAFWHG